MPSRLLFAVLIFILLFFAVTSPTNAGIWKPIGEDRDSLALHTLRGVELTRQSEHLHILIKAETRTDLELTSSWKSEWIQPGGKTERRRQDGRWHFSALHPLTKPVKLWLSTRGELFDERAATPSALISPATIRVLRGGGGAVYEPIPHLELIAGGGVIEDRRFGHVISGPLWETAGRLAGWDVSGYVQDIAFKTEWENPGSYRNRDLQARYDVRREFSPGTTGRAELEALEIRRSYFTNERDLLATRKERRARFNNGFTYAIRDDLRAEFNGELFNTKTEIEQGANKSSLEEARAVFKTGLVRRTRRFAARFGVGVSSVSQTIDGDILQGRKTNLSLTAGFQPTSRDSFYGGFEVSKYQLDTRSEQNNDDRDEVRFEFLTGAKGTFNPYLHWRTWARVTLDHLVYIFRERSANNRWTRLFLIASRLHHQPSHAFEQTFMFEISANYQAFDFEQDPRQVRSTVFRKLRAGDSLAVALTRTVSVVAQLTWKREELGRLFWREFQEERSDEVTSVYSRLEFPWQIGRRTTLVVGGLWNHRRGIRFSGGDFNQTEVFQDLQTYGPLWKFQHGLRSPLTINAGGQVVRQLELGRDDRWLVMGDIGVSIKW